MVNSKVEQVGVGSAFSASLVDLVLLILFSSPVLQ